MNSKNTLKQLIDAITVNGVHDMSRAINVTVVEANNKLESETGIRLNDLAFLFDRYNIVLLTEKQQAQFADDISFFMDQAE